MGSRYLPSSLPRLPPPLFLTHPAYSPSPSGWVELEGPRGSLSPRWLRWRPPRAEARGRGEGRKGALIFFQERRLQSKEDSDRR